MSVFHVGSSASHSRLPGKIFIILTVLVTSVFPLTLFSSEQKDRTGEDGQFSGKQGEVLWIDVPVEKPPIEVVGQFLDRKTRFFQGSERAFVGLLGIDMQDSPGLHELRITVTSQQATHTLNYSVLVEAEDYSVQRLTLPKNKVDLDRATLKRVKAEQKQLTEIFRPIGPHPLWNGAFISPLEGRVTGVFGSRRIINGQPRNPHSGEDIAAPKGTEVVAMNAGIVRLTIDHFFTGKGVVIDHGVGLYSMYFHLSEVSVSKGQSVKKRQPIGKVGATGRATGPHLHWGVRLNGSRINPYSLAKLPVTN